MLAQTIDIPRVKNWFTEEEIVTGEGLYIPFLVIDSDRSRTEGIPLVPYLMDVPEIRFYLKDKPSPGEAITKDKLLSGSLRLKLLLTMPEKVTTDMSFLHSSQLTLINQNTKEVYGESGVKAGKNISFSLNSSFGAEVCDDYYNLLSGNPSVLHIIIRMTFYVPSIHGFKTIESKQPLSMVYRISEMDFLHPENQIKFYYFDMVAGQYIVVPSLYKVNPERRRKARGEEVNPEFMVRGNKVGSKLSLMQPLNHLAIANLQHSPAVTLNQGALIKIENGILSDKTEGFPLVDNQQNKWFKDNKEKHKFWVLPDFKVIIPKANDDPDNSPFRFIFHQIGLDQNGKSVLEGEVVFTLQQIISENVRTEIKQQDANAILKMIAPKDLSVSLEIPFFDDKNDLHISSVKTEEFRYNGDQLIPVFRLTNEWVRVCYGMLSGLNPGNTPSVKLNLVYRFEGMGKKLTKLPQILLNQSIFKTAAFPVISSARSKSVGESFFDSKNKKLVLANGNEVSFKDIPKARSAKANVVLGRIVSMNKPVVQPLLHTNTLLPVTNLMKITKILQDKKLVRQSYIKQEKKDLKFECAGFGAFYREKENDGSTSSIGCKEPYKLGEVRFSLFTPLNELTTEHYKVYQSTQTPNRFLVVPTRYVITRFEPDKEDSAFQPCLRLYSTIDAEDLSRSQCVLDASLAPDVSRYELDELNVHLKRFTAYTPFISYPAEVEHQEEYQWAIPGQLSTDVDSFSLGPFIRFVVSAKIESVITLHAILRNTGLSGLVKFSLPDGSVFTSELVVSLGTINGPFINGPLITTEIDDTLHVRNGLTRSLQITQIRAYNGPDDLQVIPVEKVLKAGEEYTCEKETDRKHILEYQVEQTPETLEETRQYLEDIECQIIFITQIDFTKSKIKKLIINYGLSVSDLHQTELTPDKTMAEELMLMPLTNFYARRELVYNVSAVKETGEIVDLKHWITVSLVEDGNIINITTESISLT